MHNSVDKDSRLGRATLKSPKMSAYTQGDGGSEWLLRQAFADADGIVTTSMLYGVGFSKRDVARLVDSRQILRTTRGHFVIAGIENESRVAAHLGGRLTGVSLFAQLGGFRPFGDRLVHVAIPRTDQRPAVIPRSVKLHWSPVPGLMLHEPWQSAIGHVLRSAGVDDAVAVMESLVRQRVLTRDQVRSALESHISAGGRRALSLMRGGSESGAETLMRLWLQRHRVPYRTQVRVGGFRVDFLLGMRLIVEVVGQEFHGSPQDFERDVTREAFLQSLGYQVLRFSARQVFSRQDEIEATLRPLIRGRRHLYGSDPERG